MSRAEFFDREELNMKIEKIRERIESITTTRVPVVSRFTFEDTSTQAELRLRCHWSIVYPVDTINYPRCLDSTTTTDPDPWREMCSLETEISQISELGGDVKYLNLSANERTKSGREVREQAANAFELEMSNAFLAAYRKAVSKRSLSKIQRKISSLQSQQKYILPLMRAHNSKAIMARRDAAAERRDENQRALAEGRFWDADKAALKGYFHPPFARNYLADVSERWRAALYTEIASTAWKAGKGDWRHKNVGTGSGYLCGIDDNGDEWSHIVNLSEYVDRDEYGDIGYIATVEDAMSALFDIDARDLPQCVRQGDLLFCPEPIPETARLHYAGGGSWAVRQSHTVRLYVSRADNAD